MTRLVAVAVALFTAGIVSAAPISYEFRDSTSDDLLFTFSVNSPPAGTALGWSSSLPADLTSFVVNEQSFLPTGFTAPYTVPGPANVALIQNNGDASLLPQLGIVTFASSAPFGLSSTATLSFSGANPSALGYTWLAANPESQVTRIGEGRIVEAAAAPTIPEPASLAVFGALAVGLGVTLRQRKSVPLGV